MPELNSLTAIHQIYLYELEYGLKIHGFRPKWPYLIVKVLATLAKFLELSGYSTVIDSAFAFWIKTIFRCFYGVNNNNNNNN